MALIKFDDNEKASMGFGTAIDPPEKKYTQSKYGALADVLNSTVAAKKRGDYNRATVDMQPFQGKEFNQDNVRSHLEEQGVSPDLRDKLLTEPINDWETLDRRLAYMSSQEQSRMQVDEQMSTAGAFIAGIPFALLDPVEAVVLTPAGALLNKGYKALNQAEKAHRVVYGMGAAAAIGTGSMLTYETIEGNYEDGSLINTALISAGLGFGLGMLLEKSKYNPNLTQDSDRKGKVLSPEESKVEQLITLREELEPLNKILEDVKNLAAKEKEVKEQLSVSEKADAGVEAFDNSLARKRAFENKGKLGVEAKAAESVAEILEKQLKPIIAKADETKASVGKLAALLKTYNKESLALKTLQKELSPIKGQITKLKNNITKLSGEASKESLAKVAELQKKLDIKLRDLGKKELAIIQAQTKLRKMDGESLPGQLKSLRAESKNLGKLIASKTPEVETASAKAEKARKDYEESYNIAKETSDFTPNIKPNDSFETKKLKEELAKYKVNLSPEGLAKLAERRGVLEADLAKIQEGDFNLKALRGVTRKKQNAIAKLSREMEEIDSKMDYKLSDSFKRLPPWARKLMISPIENLLESVNRGVAGFASYLHSGTAHHGKINAMTAHILKMMLQKKLERMHQAITYHHRQAVLDGYKGNIKQFQDEMADNVYAITGRFQRDLHENIPGNIVGLEREAIVRSKVASTERQHFSENKHINNAADEYLNYYESIHEKGSALGMESFTQSLGRGYVKRVYSKEKIEKLSYNGKVGREAAIDLITDAQLAKATSISSEVTPDIVNEFRLSATKAVDSAIDRTARRNQAVKPLVPPPRSTASSFKQRTIEAFDDDLSKVLEQDVVGISNLYGLNVHGRLALKEKLGIHSDEELTAAIDALNPSAKDRDNLNVVIQDILGTRQISDNPFNPFTRGAKAISSYASIMHTLAFAVPTVTEISSIAKEFGWNKTIKSFIGTPREIIGMYRNGTPSDKNTIEMLISYADANFATKVNRGDVETSLDSVGKWQMFADDIVRREAVYGGLLPVTDMLRMTTASLSVDFMAKLSVASKISKTDAKRLHDMGFGVEDLPLIRDRLQVQPDGRILNTDRKTWGGYDSKYSLDDRITAGVMTMVERTILHPNGATLPKFMTDMNEGQFMPRIMMKFMGYPIEAYERLLVRGLQEADAKQALGLMGNIALWTLVLSAKDAIKEEDKQQFTGDDGMEKLMIQSLLYNSVTSGPVAIADTVTGLATGENLTNDYKFQAGGAVYSQIEKVQQGKVALSLPFYTLKADIGDGVANALETLGILEEGTRDD